MSWGSDTKQTQSQNQSSVNTTTPNEPSWLSSLRQSFGPYVSNIMSQAQQPVYGDSQTASYLQNLNSIANSATQTLNSNLAGHGVNNSGAYAAGATSIQNNRLGQASGFFSQLPFLQQQAMQQNQLAALAGGINLTGKAPIGQTSTGSGSSNSQSETQTDPGLAGLISSLAGLGIGAATGGGGLAGLFGGGGTPSPGPGSPSFINGIPGGNSPAGSWTPPTGFGANPFMTGWNPNSGGF